MIIGAGPGELPPVKGKAVIFGLVRHVRGTATLAQRPIHRPKNCKTCHYNTLRISKQPADH